MSVSEASTIHKCHAKISFEEGEGAPLGSANRAGEKLRSRSVRNEEFEVSKVLGVPGFLVSVRSLDDQSKALEYLKNIPTDLRVDEGAGRVHDSVRINFEILGCSQESLAVPGRSSAPEKKAGSATIVR
jgi:hypothetical protein